MGVDASKLRKLSRRNLGVPPTDGSPGIEHSSATAPAEPPTAPTFFESKEDFRGSAATTHTAQDSKRPEEFPSDPPRSDQQRLSVSSDVAGQQMNGAGEGTNASEASADAFVLPLHESPVVARSRAESANLQRRQRVPAPEAEPRLPFTTRVSASTKERLEDACHFLRMKHQDFINQAIIAHLKKHGF